jgi:hypothetical protein
MRPPRHDERARTDGYVKVSSLKSIETISMSVMGLRSGPRVHPETRWSSIALLRLGDTDARALEI